MKAVLVAGAARERLPYGVLKVLADLDPAVSQVVGFTRYRIEGDPASQIPPLQSSTAEASPATCARASSRTTHCAAPSAAWRCRKKFWSRAAGATTAP